ncbi:MAG: hypothetical protein LBT48_00720 [Prevotellaceae bacterium]|jgi:hypothetical protein|nr:hypothetical protein [Prevotellaceae bacterium]
MIWDFANYSVYFNVVNEAGHNLLDTATVGNIVGSNITVDYQGQTFKPESWDESTPDTKATMPMPLALRVEYSDHFGVTLLSFGEFSPDHHSDNKSGYKGETFIIDWGDGTKDTVKFDLYITWKKCNPTVHKSLYLNDKLYPDDSFLITIVKK